ncbi:hypothetical protein CEXT_708951 [Caerostris extrusa]|uniref:Uncharacterized protein n=1 Tax=Caerostris extrusa TaxID=172846 RepID=A0AAV4W0D6_CAEEX|nr:hypothetical protein CEXT_708951 [Caerostris extrusa]
MHTKRGRLISWQKEKKIYESRVCIENKEASASFPLTMEAGVDGGNFAHDSATRKLHESSEVSQGHGASILWRERNSDIEHRLGTKTSYVKTFTTACRSSFASSIE